MFYITPIYREFKKITFLCECYEAKHIEIDFYQSQLNMKNYIKKNVY